MRFLSLQTVADQTETSVGFWRKQIRLGRIRAARAGRRVLLDEDTVKAYLKQGGTSTPAFETRPQEAEA